MNRTLNVSIVSGVTSVAYIETCRVTYKRSDGKFVSVNVTNTTETRTYTFAITDASTGSFTIGGGYAIGNEGQEFGSVGVGVSAGTEPTDVELVFDTIL